MGIELHRHEQILASLRGLKILLWRRLAIGLFFIFVLFYYAVPLWSFGIIGAIIFLAVLGFSAFHIATAWTTWRHTLFMITDERIIDIHQKNLFKREISEVQLSQIKELSVEKSTTVDKLFGSGTLHIKVDASLSYDLEIIHLPQPHVVVDLLQELLNLRQGTSEAHEQLKHVD